jgi:hypothetical protein
MTDSLKRASVGVTLGGIMGLPPMGEFLVLYGFWGSLMWVAPIFGAIGTWLFLRRHPRFALATILLGTLAGFCITFVLFGMSRGEGSPVLAVAIGLWMSTCVVATVSPLLSFLRIMP